jgi:hypothetical protein
LERERGEVEERGSFGAAEVVVWLRVGSCGAASTAKGERRRKIC